MLAHQHVRNDVLGFTGLDRLTWTRIKRLDQIHRFLQHIFFQPGNAHQRTEVMIRQQIQMFADDQARLFKPRRLFSELGKLDKQAVT
ncbi:hypothetical protein D3C78_1527500 [compost metagenome]